MSRLAAARRFPAWVWLLASVGGVVLIGIVLVVEVRIIVVSPNLGDISSLVGALAAVVLGFATLASLALTIYSFLSEGTEGPSRTINIKGRNNEVTVNVDFSAEGDEEGAVIEVPANEREESDKKAELDDEGQDSN